MTFAADTIARLAAGWQARAPRERWMLAVMAAAIGAFAYWYAGVVPLRSLEAAGDARHQHGAARLAAVRGNLAAIRFAREAMAPTPSGEAYPATILASARDAGVSISRQRARGANGLAVGIDAVDAISLFAWLDMLRTAHGITPEVLDVGRRDGQLHAEVAFAEPQHN